MKQADDDQRPPLVPIPHTELSSDALRGVVEAFVLREGTDYGEREVAHETKVLQVMRQLERGEAEILFDPVTETVDIVVRQSAGLSGRAPRPRPHGDGNGR